MSICIKLQNKEHVTETLCRVKFTFSGSQKLHISKKGDFLNLMQMNLKTFENMVAEKWFISDGCGAKYTPIPGPLAKWWALHSREPWHCPLCSHAHNKSYFLVRKKGAKVGDFPQQVHNDEFPASESSFCSMSSSNSCFLTSHYSCFKFKLLAWFGLPNTRPPDLPLEKSVCRSGSNS